MTVPQIQSMDLSVIATMRMEVVVLNPSLETMWREHGADQYANNAYPGSRATERSSVRTVVQLCRLNGLAAYNTDSTNCFIALLALFEHLSTPVSGLPLGSARMPSSPSFPPSIRCIYWFVDPATYAYEAALEDLRNVGDCERVVYCTIEGNAKSTSATPEGHVSHCYSKIVRR